MNSASSNIFPNANWRSFASRPAACPHHLTHLCARPFLPHPPSFSPSTSASLGAGASSETWRDLAPGATTWGEPIWIRGELPMSKWRRQKWSLFEVFLWRRQMWRRSVVLMWDWGPLFYVEYHGYFNRGELLKDIYGNFEYIHGNFSDGKSDGTAQHTDRGINLFLQSMTSLVIL